MSTETFTLEYFEQTLLNTLHNHFDSNAYAITGVVGNEYQFVIAAKTFPRTDKVVNIVVNSSVQADTAVSAPNGENSIRGWLADNEGKPLGSKTQRWVTRQAGWEGRLETMISKLAEMASNICLCRSCNTLEKVFKVKKDGPNNGRLFKRCDCQGSFGWLDEDSNCEEDVVPACPKCNSKMAKRSGKYGDFWGCTNFPTCRGTLNIGQETQEPKEREDARHRLNEKLNTIGLAQQETKDLYAEAAKPKHFAPSKYQQAIFDWIDRLYDPEFADVNGKDQGNHLVVEALAGSGKTTTGMEALRRIPRDQKVLFTAFNKHIAKELQKRAPRHVKVSTLHSLGYAALRSAFKLTFDDVKSDKVDMILKNFINYDIHKHLVSPIKSLVGLVKATMSETSPDILEELAGYYGVELNGDADLIYQGVAYVISKSLEMTNVIDFDDMCYMPVMLNVPCEKYDFIFVDEAQDLNNNQLELILKHCADYTKFIAVGDRYQSLYGFRGANVDSIPNIIDFMEAQVLPLSITYRNPQSVVRLVNEEFPEIPLEAAEWAIEGDIRNESYNVALSKMRSGDMVLCRTNAPLVKPCFELIRQGVKATIRGRDIGKGLISTIRKMKASDMYDMIVKLEEYKSHEVAKLLMAKKNSQAQSLEDKVDTIIALADGCDTIACIENKIESVFSDEVEGVVFSSVHRAKGLEAKNVYILEEELMPHPMATQEWEMQQERNIQYVAYTRTLHTLVFVS